MNISRNELDSSRWRLQLSHIYFGFVDHFRLLRKKNYKKRFYCPVWTRRINSGCIQQGSDRVANYQCIFFSIECKFSNTRSHSYNPCWQNLYAHGYTIRQYGQYTAFIVSPGNSDRWQINRLIYFCQSLTTAKHSLMLRKLFEISGQYFLIYTSWYIFEYKRDYPLVCCEYL